MPAPYTDESREQDRTVPDVLLQMAALIAAGVVWRHVAPAGVDLEASRRTLTGLVFSLLLPALVLQVLWQAPLGTQSLNIALVASAGVLAGMAVAWVVYGWARVPTPSMGALLLAAAFPNATYLGLPMLEKTLGPWARSIAIQYDLFACTPLLLTLGLYVARVHGGDPAKRVERWALLRVPPLWAAVVAVVLNVWGVPMPEWLQGILGAFAAGVVPLMLIALGMSLQSSAWRGHFAPLVVPVVAIQLLLMPALVWLLARQAGLAGKVLTAVTLEGAMPSMVLGVAICDRYRLDTGLYAAAVTFSTLAAALSLPLWFRWLG